MYIYRLYALIYCFTFMHLLISTLVHLLVYNHIHTLALIHGTKKVRLPELDLWIGREFTIQSWVRLQRSSESLPPEGLPVLRQPLNQDHSCWSWNFPPSLSFGAHDFGGFSPNPVTGLYEEYVAPTYPRLYEELETFPEQDRLVLHTMIVNVTHVQFLTGDGELLEPVIPLPRPVTDCDSMGNLLLGSEGLTLVAARAGKP